MPGTIESNSRGETLQSVPRERNHELRVYSKRKHQQKSMTQAQPDQLQADQNQSVFPGNNNANSGNPSNPTSNPASIVELPVHSDNTQHVPILTIYLLITCLLL